MVLFPSVGLWVSFFLYIERKGTQKNPDSHRGITLVSPIGKLFTTIINTRLSKYADIAEIIPNIQAGFRKGYSTLDNIFCLHVLIDIYLSLGKKTVLFGD